MSPLSGGIDLNLIAAFLCQLEKTVSRMHLKSVSKVSLILPVSMHVSGGTGQAKKWPHSISFPRYPDAHIFFDLFMFL